MFNSNGFSVRAALYHTNKALLLRVFFNLLGVLAITGVVRIETKFFNAHL